MYAEGENTNELRAGHPPAVKVSGGMRVPQRDKRNRSGSADKRMRKDVEKMDEFPAATFTNNILAHTGLAALTKREFPEEAIRAYHDKPVASKQNLSRPWSATNTKNQGSGTSRHIFQPRRFNTSGGKDLPHNSPNKIN